MLFMGTNLSHIVRRSLSTVSFKPWHLLGFGYYQAWVYLAVMSTVLYPDSQFFNESLAFTRQYYSISLSVALIVLVLIVGKFDLLQQRWVLAGSASLTFAGTLVIALPVYFGSASLPVAIVGITLTSIGNALCILAWGALWASIAANRMGMHIVVSNCFAGVLYLIVVMLPALAAIAATALLPVASLVTLLCCKDEPPREEALPEHPARKLIIKIVAILALVPLVYGVARAFSSLDFASEFTGSYRHVIFGITCFAFILMVVSASAPRERIVMRMYRLIMPLMIIGFTAYSFVGEGERWLAFAAIGCGFYSFEGLVWLLYPQLVLKFKGSSYVVFGWSRALFHLFGFAGATIGYGLVDHGMADAPFINIICLGIVVLLVFTMTYVFTEHDLRLFVKPSSSDSGESGSSKEANSISGPTVSEDLETLCAGLTQQYGLSKRESEVLLLLAKGRSAPFIADEFTVSLGTVKTHIRHIYEKVGVHSKQELLDLIEAARQR